MLFLKALFSNPSSFIFMIIYYRFFFFFDNCILFCKFFLIFNKYLSYVNIDLQSL